MAWRTIMLQNPARLQLKQGQLQLENDGGIVTLPLEDITALILESPQISLTSALLSACQERGIAIITCDNAHIPNGVLLPFLPHSRQSGIAHLQQSWDKPLRKRLWQKIIQSKILNQAVCLEKTIDKQTAKKLTGFVGQVGSGDPQNIEAQAARVYWPLLLGKDFRRHSTAPNHFMDNAALNYGYAIMRAFVARAQVAYGLIPAFGIHHCNELNAFNLTDDAMEVLRPFVDYMVYNLKNKGEIPASEDKLSIQTRQVLANIGNTHCEINKQKHTIATACDLMATSLVSAIRAKNPALLALPEFAFASCNKEAGNERS